MGEAKQAPTGDSKALTTPVVQRLTPAFSGCRQRERGARDERTLEAVSGKALLGQFKAKGKT
jgi:hypothetical protein